MTTAPTVWSDATAPGGEVCAVPTPTGICGMPVETEPCTIHARCVRCNHAGGDHDGGECWDRVDGAQCSCSWYTPAYEVTSVGPNIAPYLHTTPPSKETQ